MSGRRVHGGGVLAREGGWGEHVRVLVRVLVRAGACNACSRVLMRACMQGGVHATCCARDRSMCLHASRHALSEVLRHLASRRTQVCGVRL